ncbi:MAG: hypothetical protein GWO20_10600 [Candidatus Korarchaeota archaeon]|nr:hypothetical protein [Candidatus Korarchaeota archaeon]NIU83932.1 hypothetical protein [Candidatus Thorarchaeota archaeon]NIW14060.1 hypothetical protein [Candidatus Thorarchaeota archaeon]NIW52170.1 hypothetical protein [Candidatus Korarchaeota archaeon]
MEGVKADLKSIAENFSLTFKEKWFSYATLPPRKLVICLFLLGCPLPEYQKLGSGRSIEQRFENLQTFVESTFFQERTRKYKHHERSGGTIVHKSCLAYRKHLPRIEDARLREEVESIFEKVAQHMSGEVIAVLCETMNEKMSKHVLKHEWGHVLLEKNDISFQKQGKSWRWDEGLVTYMTQYPSPPWGRRGDAHSQYAQKWKKLLENCETPTERLAKIKEQLRA